MKRTSKPIASKLKGTQIVNPFKDSQAKTFSNEKIINEFYPTQFFWDLFNDQHEVLIGTRGCGKTILLKMMQYSMLKKLDDHRAKDIVINKKYISLFIPTHVEFLRTINFVGDKDYTIMYFQFGFNCLLARTMIQQLMDMIRDIHDFDTIAMINSEYKLCQLISKMWFKDQIANSAKDLIYIIDDMFHNFDFKNPDSLEEAPIIFTKRIGSPIQSISTHVKEFLQISHDPIWLICIDEAEFMEEKHQVCINTLFRAYNNNIVVKMATLPFKHTTLKTLITNEYAEPNGNDFNYRSIDYDPNGSDFINLTNVLTKNRLNGVANIKKTISELKDFVGVIGSEKISDYYNLTLNRERSKKGNLLEKEIISQVSEERRIKALENGIGSEKNRKTLTDKFAPIFFLRELYKLSIQGRTIPILYAGSKMIREASNGNPRLFIQIMNLLFEHAKKTELNYKQQHVAILKYAEQFEDTTKRLPVEGACLSEIITKIANYLFKKTHGDVLVDVGNTFQVDNENLTNLKKALELGVAYSRLKVDKKSLINGITDKTVFHLNNLLSMCYWLPMRKSNPIVKYQETLALKKIKDNSQLRLFKND